MSGRVIVVGSVNIDLVARVPHLPHPGETVTGGSYDRHHGGKGGNQACLLYTSPSPRDRQKSRMPSSA